MKSGSWMVTTSKSGPWTGALVGVCLLLICGTLARASPREGLLSYLFAFLFFTGLSVGSLALLLLHVLTGGTWGESLRTPLLAAAGTLRLQALLAVPILVGLRDLYPWASAAARVRDALLRQQSWYLDPGFFVLRTIACFVLWLGLLAMLRRLLEQAAPTAWLSRVAAVGLIIYALSTLLVATDWAMSLRPHWHSSVFGMMLATQWMLAAAALAILRAVTAHDGTAVKTARLLQDLGNLLLMFLLAWSYLALMQYLTVWIADQPAEIAWYIPRTLTSWRLLGWFLVAGQVALPFAMLLSRDAKRDRRSLGAIAALLLIGALADALWITIPDVREQGFALQWSDLLAAAGMGALWFSVYCAGLRSSAERRASGQRSLETVHG